MAPKVWRSQFLAVVLVGVFVVPVAAFRAPSPALAQAKAPGGEEMFQGLADQAGRAQHAGESEEAIRLYLKALRIRPRWADGWRNLGILLAARKDYKRAEAAFKSLLQIEPKDGPGWAMLGLCEYEQGRVEAAYPHLERAQSLHIANADLDKIATFDSALILIQKGEFPMAMSRLVRVAHLSSDDMDLVTAFGLDALRMATTPDKLDPTLAPLVTRVGQIEFEAVGGGTPAERTLGAFKNLLEERPDDPRLHYAYGDFLLTIARYDQGIEEMKQTLALDPRDFMAMLQLALTYVKMGDAEQALPYAEKAVELAPKSFAGRYALGWTLYRLGKTDRAIKELQTAVGLEPSDARAHYALSEAYMQAHRKADAQREREIFAKLKKQEEPEPSAPSTRVAQP